MKNHEQKALSAKFIALKKERDVVAAELTNMMLELCAKKVHELQANAEALKAISIRDFRILAKMMHDLEKDYRAYLEGCYPSIPLSPALGAPVQNEPMTAQTDLQTKTQETQNEASRATRPPVPQMKMSLRPKRKSGSLAAQSPIFSGPVLGKQATTMPDNDLLSIQNGLQHIDSLFAKTFGADYLTT